MNAEIALTRLAAKDHELQQAVKDHDTQLLQVTQSLAEFKHRALTAEVGYCSPFSHLPRMLNLFFYRCNLRNLIRAHREQLSLRKK